MSDEIRPDLLQAMAEATRGASESLGDHGEVTRTIVIAESSMGDQRRMVASGSSGVNSLTDVLGLLRCATVQMEERLRMSVDLPPREGHD